MTIEKARELLGENYKDSSDETIQALIDLILSVCVFTIQGRIDTKEKK